MLEGTLNSGVKFFKDECQDGPAMYFYGSNQIIFRDLAALNEWAIFEELTHAYQNQFYPDGLAQYGEGMPGHTNMEFEAKLLHAIFHFENATLNTLLQQVFNSQQEWEEVLKWLDKYMQQGITSDFLLNYDRFLQVFNNKTTYGGFIDPNFPKMSFIEFLRSECGN